MKYAKPLFYNHAKEKDFQTALKSRVNDYFSSRDLSTKASPLMWVKTILYIALYYGTWATLALQTHTPTITVSLMIFFAIMTILLAFNVCHDAVHQAISGNKNIDHWIFYLTFNLLGPNAYLWKIRHNNAHHFFVNIPGSDMDIDGTDMIRVAPHKEWKPFHRFQHFYCGLLYSIFTMHWILVKDFKIFRMKTFGNVTDLKHSPWRMVEMIAWKMIYLSYMIGIPALVLPYSLGSIMIAFVSFHLFMSFWLLIFFAASHISTESHYVVQDQDGNMPHSFYEHQLLTSVDFHPRNKIFGFFFGGFNAHVAHHMFPQYASVHYSELSKIIKETATEFKLPYQEMNILEIIIDHFQMMKTLGAHAQAGQEFIIKIKKERGIA